MLELCEVTLEKLGEGQTRILSLNLSLFQSEKLKTKNSGLTCLMGNSKLNSM